MGFSARLFAGARRLLGAAILAIAVISLSPRAGIAAPATLSGTLPDGTAYRIEKPADWNGAVLLDLDYAGRPDDPRSTLLLSRGYAMAGTTRLRTGWNVPASVDNLVATLDLFEKSFGKPRWAVAFGGSLGGHTAATAINLRSDRFDGAVSMCSSPAGAVATWNEKLDALFVAKALLAPQSDLPITDIPADFQQTSLPAWQAMFAKAQATPEGRARIALAGVLAQLPTWSDPDKPEPAANDVDGREQGLYDSLSGGRLPVVGQALSSRRQITGLAGGGFSWNDGVDYRAELDRLPEKALIEALYRKAGLSLDADLDRLATAQRITADPKAVVYLGPQVFSGALKVPVLTLHAVGDPIAPPAGTQPYAVAAAAAGRSAMLRQVYTDSAGHCAFSPLEIGAAADTLLARLRTGVWPDTSPAAMSARARALGEGPVRFIDYTPEVFLRPFTTKDLAAMRQRVAQ